jgi:hypothetical protein
VVEWVAGTARDIPDEPELGMGTSCVAGVLESCEMLRDVEGVFDGKIVGDKDVRGLALEVGSEFESLGEALVRSADCSEM